MAKSKKLFAVLLALCLICAGALFQHVFGDQEPESSGTTGAYVYKHDPGYWYQYRSPHRYNCEVNGEEHNDYAPAIYRLLNGKDVELGYCCDLKTGIEVGTYYKRLNLEESGYYTADQAEHIRGILNAGFWEGNGINSADRINALAEASGITAKGETLTAAEALSATQLAIWYYANEIDERGQAKVTSLYSKSLAADLNSNYGRIADTTLVDVREKCPETVLNSIDKTAKEHIEAVYSYLTTKATAAKPESVIWNFDGKGIVVTAKADTSGESVSYDAKVMFTLSGSDGEGAKDSLFVTAQPVMKEGAEAIKAQKIALKDLQEESGYYVITFEDLTEEQIQAITEISFTLEGTQKVAQDAYFYEPYGGRTTAQCFVGIASGQTPVHREWTLDVTMAGASLNMVKYDSTSVTETGGEGLVQIEGGKYAYPVQGAVFQLYAEFTDGTSVKVGPEATTDQNGQISWSALITADNLKEYYVKEVSAPEGYTLSRDTSFTLDQKRTVYTVYIGDAHDTGSLTICKEVEGDDKSNHFNFEVMVDFSKAKLFEKLTAGEKAIRAGQIEWEGVDTSDDTEKELHPAISWTQSSDGNVLTARISLADGEAMQISGLPEGTQCTVTELTEDGEKPSDSDEYVFVYGDTPYINTDAVRTVTIEAGETAESAVAAFKNTQTDKAEAVFQGQKYLDNRDSQVGFSFSLAELSESGIRGKTLETVTNDENGTFTFSPVYFSTPGTYRYQVWEEYTLSGYLYDARVYTIEVTVHRTEDGKLTAATVITTPSAIQQPDSDGSGGNETGRVDSIEFSNRTWSSVIDYDSVTVKKDWNLDKGGSTQPIQVQLLKNGILYDTVTLSSSNGWRYTWIRLEKGQQWTVQEVNVPEGFSAEVTKEGTIFTITNTYTGEGIADKDDNGGDNGNNGPGDNENGGNGSSGDNGNSSGNNGNGTGDSGNANGGTNAGSGGSQNENGANASDETDGPYTGDSVELTTWILLLLIAILGLAVAAGTERKQK